MGRSVSRPSNACITVYAHCENEHDEDGNFDADLTQMNWDDAVLNMQCELIAKDKSFSKCDQWLGYGNSEDHALLENDSFYVGVSEYCGLVAVWAVPKEREEDECDEPLIAGIAKVRRERRETRYLKRLEKWLVEGAGYFGETLRHVGTFSNGEAVYERRAA